MLLNEVGNWAETYSLPMMDDGTITWYTERNGGFLRKLFNQLEEDVPSLNFKKVRNPDDAEIDIYRTNDLPKNWLGVARGMPSDWTLEIRKGRKHMSTIVHEIGHALGLDHPESHWDDRDSIMSYYRDRSIASFYPKDIDELTGLWSK